MTLEEAQKQVDSWIKEYGVRYFSELTNMAILTEEVGELARVMARKYGDQSFKKGADLATQWRQAAVEKDVPFSHGTCVDLNYSLVHPGLVKK